MTERIKKYLGFSFIWTVCKLFQIACHKAKIKEETHAGHQNQIFLMYYNKIQIIFMVLVHLHYVHGHEILNCTLIYSTVICHKRILRQNRWVCNK